MAEGKVESLVVKIDSPPGLENVPYRMLTEDEQRQLRQTKLDGSDYLQRIAPTPILD